MKKTSTLAIAAAVLTTAVAAQAGPGGGGMIGRFDADKNGSITRAEIAQSTAAQFKAIDANGDQRVTKEEMQAHHEKMKAQWAEKRKAAGKPERADRGGRDGKRGDHFARLDTNSDGALTQAEFAARANKRLERLDANKDGVITQDEIAQARQHRRGDREGRSGQPS